MPNFCLLILTFCYLLQSSIQEGLYLVFVYRFFVIKYFYILIDLIDDQRNDLPVETITVEDDVYVLDQSNYDSFIATHRVALVAFLG